MTRRTRPLLIVLAGLFRAHGAAAQDAAPAARAQAVELFDAASALAEKGRYADACPKYAESYRLDPQLGAVLHLADCLEHNGQFASAYAAFREASELAAKKSDPREQLANDRAKALEPKLSRITVNVPGAARVQGLTLNRDGIAMPEATWGTAIAVDPGEHKIEATAPGYAPWSTQVTLNADGAAQAVDVPALTALNAGSAPAAGSTSGDSGGSSHGGTQRALAYAVGGLGLAGVGVGIGFAVIRSNKIDQANAICPTNVCPPGTASQEQVRLNQLNQDARTAGKISIAAFIGGGVALAGGATLWLTAPRGPKNEHAELHVTPWFDTRGGGLVAARSF